VLAARLPRPARPIIRPIMAVLVDDPRMATALGLRPGPQVVARLVFAALWIRGKLSKPARIDTFKPGRSGRTMYPNGYSLEDLGPRAAKE
jgi:hypothetical protein